VIPEAFLEQIRTASSGAIAGFLDVHMQSLTVRP
jgi:hypothetical protein